MVFTGQDDILYRTTSLGNTKTVDWSKVSVNTAAQTNAGWNELFTATGNPSQGTFSGNIPYLMTNAGANQTGICAGPDGNIWFTDSAFKVWKMTSSGVQTSITTLGNIAQICLGSDGNLWTSTPTSGSGVSRITPLGVVTDFPNASITISQPICSGPDGNIWVADSFTGHGVWKITTSGVITQYPIASAQVSDICPGSDGNVWVIDNSLKKVYKITTSGSITTYSPAFTAGPTSCCLGPDGNVWILEPNAGSTKIWKITTSGVSTSYSVTGTTNLNDLCSGSDGNVWVVDKGSGSNTLFKITTSGVQTSYPAACFNPSAPPLSVICAGPDGNVWSQDINGRIWQINTGITAVGVATAMTPSTIGAIPLNSNVSPSTRHLLNMQATANISLGTVMLVDYLLYYSGLVVTGTPTTLDNTVTLPRYTNGKGVMGAVFVQSLLGAASPLLTLTMTCDDGSTQTATCKADANALKASQAFRSGSNAAGGGLFLHIPGGLQGIKSINSYTLASGTTGIVCFVLFKPLVSIPITLANQLSEMDFLNQFPSLPQIQDGACLGLMVGNNVPFASVTVPYQGRIQFCWGP